MAHNVKPRQEGDTRYCALDSHESIVMKGCVSRGKSEYLTMQNISEHVYSCPEGMQQDLRDLVDQLLQQHPAQRIGFHDLLELQHHPFFKGVHDRVVRPVCHVMSSSIPWANTLAKCTSRLLHFVRARWHAVGVDWVTLREQEAPQLCRSRMRAEPSEGDMWEMNALQNNLPLR